MHTVIFFPFTAAPIITVKAHLIPHFTFGQKPREKETVSKVILLGSSINIQWPRLRLVNWCHAWSITPNSWWLGVSAEGAWRQRLREGWCGETYVLPVPGVLAWNRLVCRRRSSVTEEEAKSLTDLTFITVPFLSSLLMLATSVSLWFLTACCILVLL